MKQGFVTEAAQTTVSMYNLYLLPYHDVPKHWKEGEDCRERRGSVYDGERDVVYFDTVCEISNALAIIVCMGNYDDFMAPVYELR